MVLLTLDVGVPVVYMNSFKIFHPLLAKLELRLVHAFALRKKNNK
jgi:hypothetical protein